MPIFRCQRHLVSIFGEYFTADKENFIIQVRYTDEEYYMPKSGIKQSQPDGACVGTNYSIFTYKIDEVRYPDNERHPELAHQKIEKSGLIY